MKYSFKKFNRENILGDTRISLTKSRAIRFPSGFLKINKLDNFRYLILFYDRENMAIGMQPVNKPEKGAFKLTKEAGGAVSISAVSFLKSNNIDLNTYSGRYEWKEVNIKEIGTLYVIELTK